MHGSVIRLLTNEFLERTIPLNSPRVRIGRHPTMDVVLDDKSVSRTHAALVLRNGKWHAEDLGSRNGTFVNGRKATECRLEHGDVLWAASCRMELVARAPDDDTAESNRTAFLSGDMPCAVYADFLESRGVSATRVCPKCPSDSPCTDCDDTRRFLESSADALRGEDFVRMVDLAQFQPEWMPFLARRLDEGGRVTAMVTRVFGDLGFSNNEDLTCGMRWLIHHGKRPLEVRFGNAFRHRWWTEEEIGIPPGLNSAHVLPAGLRTRRVDLEDRMQRGSDYGFAEAMFGAAAGCIDFFDDCPFCRHDSSARPVRTCDRCAGTGLIPPTPSNDPNVIEAFH